MEFLDSSALLPALNSTTTYFNQESYKTLRAQCSAHKGSRSTGYTIFPELLYHQPELEQTFGTEQDILAQWNKARISIRDAIWDKQNFSEVLDAHPILTLVPQSWWESVNFVAWVQGWGDANKEKTLNSVSALLGWSLLSRVIESQTTVQVMEGSKAARFLLLVGQEISNLQGQEPFWHAVLPNLRSSLGTREAYEDREDEEGDGGEEADEDDLGDLISGSDREGPMLKAQKTGKLAVDIASGQANSNSSKSKGNSKSSHKDPSMIAASDHAATSRNAVAPISRAIIADSSDDDQEPSQERQHSHPPITALQRASNNSTSRDSADINNSDGLNHAGIEGRVNLVGNNVPRSATTEGAEPGRSDPTRQGNTTTTDGRKASQLSVTYTSVYELLQLANPGHIAISASTLCNSPGNILALQKFSLALESPRALGKEKKNLRRSIQNIREVLEQIEKHRRDFRSSLLYIASIASKSRNHFPFAMEFTITCLQRDVLAMRDIFVARLAATFTDYYGGDPDLGMAEAMLLAHADNLFDAELLTIDRTTGSIDLNILPTYPSGIREHVNYEVLDMGVIPPEDVSRFPEITARMNAFLPIHGYGVSRLEVEGRGLVGVAHLAGRVNNKQRGNLSNLVPNAEAFATPESHFQPQHKEIASWIATPARLVVKPPGLKLISAPYERITNAYCSPWSSGDFLPGAEAVEGELGVLLGSVGVHCGRAWNHISRNSILNYEKTIQPSDFIETQGRDAHRTESSSTLRSKRNTDCIEDEDEDLEEGKGRRDKEEDEDEDEDDDQLDHGKDYHVHTSEGEGDQAREEPRSSLGNIPWSPSSPAILQGISQRLGGLEPFQNIETGTDFNLQEPSRVPSPSSPKTPPRNFLSSESLKRKTAPSDLDAGNHSARNNASVRSTRTPTGPPETPRKRTGAQKALNRRTRHDNVNEGTGVGQRNHRF